MNALHKKKAFETVTWITLPLIYHLSFAKHVAFLKEMVISMYHIRWKWGVLLHFQCPMLNSTKLFFFKYYIQQLEQTTISPVSILSGGVSESISNVLSKPCLIKSCIWFWFICLFGWLVAFFSFVDILLV